MMTIEERCQLGVDTHHQGYNCCQAVLNAYHDVLHASHEEAMRMGYGMGSGVGMTRNLCGTLSGGAMVISDVLGQEDANQQLKMKIYKIIQEVYKEFEDKYGDVNCGVLLSLRKSDPFKNGPKCDEMIQEVIRLIEKYVIV